MYSIGNIQLLDNDPMVIYCSRDVPLSVYRPALKLVQSLMTMPLTLASGWHSTIEKAALKTRPPGAPSYIIFFLAKGVNDFIIPSDLRNELDAEKALFISPFMKGKRIDSKKVAKRDEMILNLINRYLFLNIDEGGNLDRLFERCLDLKKEVFLLDHFSNHGWAIDKVEVVSEDNLGDFILA